jgi:superfamily II DNA or RNA helicase
MSPFSINDVPWGEPKVIDTKHGKRRIREWPIQGESFWKEWRTGYLRQQGYSISKWKGEWRLTEWSDVDGELVTKDLEAVKQREAIQQRAEQAEAELPDDLMKRFLEVCEIYHEIEKETGNNYRYQLPSVRRLAMVLDGFNGALDASDTGTGKTGVAVAVAKVLGRKLFVVCPKNIMRPWKRMARRFKVGIDVINYEMLKTGRTQYGEWVEKVHPKSGRKWRQFEFTDLDPDNRLFVFDECHRLKDATTQNCHMGIAALDQGYKVIGASATAADNPLHMKFVALLTDLIAHPNAYWGWARAHGVVKARFGWEFVGGRDVLSKIHRQIFPARGTRIRIADLGDRFPQTQIISEAYDMNGLASQINDVYAEMHRELAKLEESKRRDKGSCILTELLRARQKVELLKVPTIVQMAKDGRDEGNAVVVVLNFQDSVTAVSKKLRTTNTITGEDNMEHRQRLIDRFNADDEDIVVMNIKAGGLGIDLQGTVKGKPRLVLISPTYSGIDLKQALGRCHRAGGAHSVQKIVWAADTLEESVCEKVRARMQRVSVFNDDQLDATLAI